MIDKMAMSNREIYKLLKHAADGKDCKGYYKDYLHLVWAGLVNWGLGSAWLTDEGKKVLEQLEKEYG